MLKRWKVAVLAGVMLAGTAGVASADPRVRFSVSIGAPVVVAAPVYYPSGYSSGYTGYTYYPAPAVVYSPPAPVYYYPPAAYYSPPVRIVYRGNSHRRHNHRNWR